MEIINDLIEMSDDNGSGLRCIQCNWEDFCEKQELIPFNKVLEYLDDHMCEYDVHKIDSYAEWIEKFEIEMKKYILK